MQTKDLEKRSEEQCTIEYLSSAGDSCFPFVSLIMLVLVHVFALLHVSDYQKAPASPIG